MLELLMWKSSDCVFVFHPKTAYFERTQFSSEAAESEIAVWTGEGKKEWGLATFDGAGDTSDYCGNMIGEYQIDSVASDNSYVYRIRGGASYLCKVGAEWVVQVRGNGSSVTHLKNISDSIAPPNTGWLFNKNGTFVLDPLLLLSTIPSKEDHCRVIMISSLLNTHPPIVMSRNPCPTCLYCHLINVFQT